MPYTIRKRKCKQSDGDSGSYVLSYKDKKGKKHRACHTSRKKARGQIAAIEAEGVERNETMRITLSNLRRVIQEEIVSEVASSVSGLLNKDSLLRSIKKGDTEAVREKLKTLVTSPLAISDDVKGKINTFLASSMDEAALNVLFGDDTRSRMLGQTEKGVASGLANRGSIGLAEIRSMIRRALNEAFAFKPVDLDVIQTALNNLSQVRDNAGLTAAIDQALEKHKGSSEPHAMDLVADLITMRQDAELAENMSELNAVKDRVTALFTKHLNSDPERQRASIEQATAAKLGAGMRKQVAGAGVKQPSSKGSFVPSHFDITSIAQLESIQSLKALIQEIVLEEAKKSKAKKGRDMDGDGDVDAADYKTKVYMAGGVPKNKALKMSRKFDGK